MPLLNYSTDIDAWKTISEIQQILAKAGASHFSIKNLGAQPAAVSFAIDLYGQPLNFLLPCDTKGILAKFKANAAMRKNLRGKQLDLPYQANNVGWRIIKDWIEAQCALVEIEMASIAEVFLPYLVINQAGETLAKKMLEPGGMKLLKFE